MAGSRILVTMHFWKAHAYGNDFLYTAFADVVSADPAALARHMCARTLRLHKITHKERGHLAAAVEHGIDHQIQPQCPRRGFRRIAMIGDVARTLDVALPA